jgi:Plasmid pRiA4b ORF-3-like protein
MGAPVVYRFHIALRGVAPKIWRRLELTASSSLADLQRVIQISLGWSDEYQHRFCIRNHYLGASRPGGLLFFGDPEEMPLSRFAFRLNERFTYEYNFFDAWILDIRFGGEHPLDPKRRYPHCIAGARRAPPEDIGGAESFMDRQVLEMPGARKARHVDRQLRDIAKLLEDPALDDVAFRTRSRAILSRRLKSDFDHRAVNDCTISRNGPARFRLNGPTLHGLPAEPRFESSTRPFSLRQVFWL